MYAIRSYYALKELDTQRDFCPAVSRIGVISQEPGLRIRRDDGEIYQCRRKGFDHFG